MQIHNLIQGSPEWHQFRFEHDGSSECAPMLGLSKKVTRTELLHMKSTGTPREFSDWVQKNILDYGHEVEALARPIIEQIFGIDLYPVTCSDGRPSASCDGLTMDEAIAFEHKQPNKELVASVRAGIVPEEHLPQCQQILMVTGAEKVIFTVSDGTRENMVWVEVFPDPDWFDRIHAGWEQFTKDRENYVHVVHAEKPQPNAIMQLPALAVQIRGEVLTSNLPAFKKAAETYIAKINTDLKTDDDFANAEATIKFCGEAEKNLELTKAAAIAQTETIDELMRTIDFIRDELRGKRLMLTGLVKTQKEAIKGKILADGRLKFADHVAAIEAEIKPIRLPYIQPDFAGAIKNKRTLASLHDAVDSTLANAKIATDATAKEVRAKLAWHKESAAGYEFLFADMQHIIGKASDDFQMLVQNRIDQHKLDEKKKIEQKAAELLASQKVAPVIAQAPETPKPTLVKTESTQLSAKQSSIGNVDGIRLALARREAEAFRTRYSGLVELVMVMEEIDSFLDATAPKEAQRESAEA
jgi:predicted phage-related endonuclease